MSHQESHREPTRSSRRAVFFLRLVTLGARRAARGQVDFIFMIDASQSMQDKIDAVKAGLQGFVDEIVKQSAA